MIKSVASGHIEDMNALQSAKPWLSLLLAVSVLGCDGEGPEQDNAAQLAIDAASLDPELTAEPEEGSAYVVRLDLERDFERTAEEAFAVRFVDGFRFEIGMRIEDHEFLLEDGETSIELDLAAPDYSEVSFADEIQVVRGSPVVALSVGDSSFCGDALVRSYHVEQQPVGLIVDMGYQNMASTSDFATENEHQAANATDASPVGDILYSRFNRCDRFVGWDGKCGGVCGKYRLWIEELWGEYSYGHCVPAGEYWLSSCTCTGPYGPWVH
ncbi:MAG: hypothetical protein AAGA54_31680 [Myxococcota bacterium]